MRTGIYAGSFDPVTMGHVDIMRRASTLVDRLIIGVAEHNSKERFLFTSQQRCDFIKHHIHFPADVQVISGLLVDFAKDNNANVLFRGLRVVADFDYELQMAMMNARLAPEIETVFLMASEKHQFIASRLVKEVARLGGTIDTFVPPDVAKALKEVYGQTPKTP
ncbi:MAG: pantetheine-phosphate adenylyltransferase [Alphaproteobacteria bacterium]